MSVNCALLATDGLYVERQEEPEVQSECHLGDSTVETSVVWTWWCLEV